MKPKCCLFQCRASRCIARSGGLPSTGDQRYGHLIRETDQQSSCPEARLMTSMCLSSAHFEVACALSCASETLLLRPGLHVPKSLLSGASNRADVGP